MVLEVKVLLYIPITADKPSPNLFFSSSLRTLHADAYHTFKCCVSPMPPVKKSQGTFQFTTTSLATTQVVVCVFQSIAHRENVATPHTLSLFEESFEIDLAVIWFLWDFCFIQICFNSNFLLEFLITC